MPSRSMYEAPFYHIIQYGEDKYVKRTAKVHITRILYHGRFLRVHSPRIFWTKNPSEARRWEQRGWAIRFRNTLREALFNAENKPKYLSVIPIYEIGEHYEPVLNHGNNPHS